MEVKLKSGRKIKIKSDISLDDRDSLLDDLKYQTDADGNITGFECMNATVTKWLRKGLDGGNSDKELLGWSIEERTDAFLKIQKKLMVGEGKASK